jgi:hypothetical protein
LARQLLDESPVISEEVKPTSSLSSMPSPLARIFGYDTDRKPESETQGFTAVEQAKHQMKRDLIEEGNKPVVQTAQPTHDLTPVKTCRKPRNQRFADSSTSYALEQKLKSISMQAGSQKLDILSAEWECPDLLRAADEAIAQHRKVPMSSDGLLQTITNILEAQEAAQAVSNA